MKMKQGDTVIDNESGKDVLIVGLAEFSHIDNYQVAIIELSNGTRVRRIQTKLTAIDRKCVFCGLNEHRGVCANCEEDN